MKSQLRVACTALGQRIMAGYPAASGNRFRGEPVDVTSDCLKAVIDKVTPGHAVTVTEDGVPRYEISVRDLTINTAP